MSVLKWLQEHRRQQMEERLKLGADYEQRDLLFATAEGKPLRHASITLTLDTYSHVLPSMQQGGRTLERILYG
jgi:hypothetical protein